MSHRAASFLLTILLQETKMRTTQMLCLVWGKKNVRQTYSCFIFVLNYWKSIPINFFKQAAKVKQKNGRQKLNMKKYINLNDFCSIIWGCVKTLKLWQSGIKAYLCFVKITLHCSNCQSIKIKWSKKFSHSISKKTII